jgi:hypothetical protein
MLTSVLGDWIGLCIICYILAFLSLKMFVWWSSWTLVQQNIYLHHSCVVDLDPKRDNYRGM